MKVTQSSGRMAKINPFNVVKLLFDEFNTLNYNLTPINSMGIVSKNKGKI